MNTRNQYTQTSSEEQSTSKVALIDAGATLIAQIKEEHEADRQSRTSEKPTDSSERPNR
jgi:hypothetical protein